MSNSEPAALVNHYRDRWAAARLAKAPIDRAAAEQGVELAYHLAGLAPPKRIVWCDGPIAAASDWATHRHDSSIGANVRSAIFERVQTQAVAGVRASAPRIAWHSALAGLRSSTADTVSAEIMRTVTRGAGLARGRGSPSISRLLSVLFNRGFKLTRPPPAWPSFARASFSPYELGWLGAYQYLHDAAGMQRQTEVLGGLWKLGLEAGWVLPHANVCWLAERPSALQYDVRGRLHCATGPALAFPDGWSVYSWKGVEVPSDLIEQREAITIEKVDDTRDIIIRRCMIEIMTPKLFIARGGANLVSHDETGMLWRRSWWNGDAWAAVEVVTGTPEPDGTRQTYVLQVPAEMRSARAAVAWTYGVSEHEYSKLGLRT